MSYTIQSIFSCAGGLDYGFSRMPNLSILNATDIEKAALKIYSQNLNPLSVTAEDIFKLPKEHFKQAGILLGSMPCNNASNQNQSKELSPLFKIIDSWFDVFQWTGAEIGISENVPQLQTVFGGKAWEYIKERAKCLNLKIFCQKINFRDYGIPQNRIRLVFIVTKIHSYNENDFFPAPTTPGSNLCIRDVVKGCDITWRKPVTQRAVDGFIRRSQTQYRLQINSMDKPAFAVVAHLKKESKWGLIEDPQNYDLILPAGCTDYLVERDIPIRCLSVSECAAIQGFPDFIWPSKKRDSEGNWTGYNEAYWAIGHAVPPHYSTLWANHLNRNIFDKRDGDLPVHEKEYSSCMNNQYEFRFN